MITNPFAEAKPMAPAVFGALLAALVTGALGALLLFYVHPPMVVDKQGVLSLDLAVLGQTALALLRGDMCGVGLAKLLGIACRLDYAGGIVEIVEGSRPALIHFAAMITAIGAAFITSLVLIVNRTPKREQLRTLQGSRLLFDADGRAGMRAAIAKTGQPQKQGLWLTPHVQLSEVAEGYNVLCVGTHGSGKSSTQRSLAHQVIARGDHVLISDVKGDITAGLPTKRFILVAPHDQRSAAYDIADDIRNRQHATEFAAHAIPIAKGEPPMWGQGSRGLWTDLTMVLAADKPGCWSWGDLRDQLLSSGAAIKETLERHGMVDGAGRLVFGGSDPEENKTTMSLLLTMWVAALTTVVPLADAWQQVPENRRFSLRRWLRSDTKLPRVIVLQKSSEYPELSSLVGSFLVDRLVGLALRPGRNHRGMEGTKPGNRAAQLEPRLTLCLDELPECGRLHRLPNLLNVGREFRVVTIAAVQDLAQLTEIYGENLSEVILARFRIKLIHQLDAGNTADRISKLLGTRRVEFLGPARRDPASGRLVQNLDRDIIAVFPGDRFQMEIGVRLKGRRKIVRLMVMGLGNPAIVDVPLTVWRDQRPGHVAADWLNE
jgi:hypothetical protein